MRELVEEIMQKAIDDAQELKLYENQTNPEMRAATHDIMSLCFNLLLAAFKENGTVEDFVVQIDDKNNNQQTIDDGSLVIEIFVKYPDNKVLRYFYDLHVDGLEKEVFESDLP